ncbi:CinA family protein [Coriobacterium glomerans]|nr:CinA family protein [Coriobacterium glomerans]
MADLSRLDDIAFDVVECACAHGASVALAESLTAGLVASAIAAIPGASRVLLGSAVTYTDTVKQRLLGVSKRTISLRSAVSRETACEMAQGARRLFGADISVSLTGYAGPGGGTPIDPVGTVYLAVSDNYGTCCERDAFVGDRNEIRLLCARRALELLLEHLAKIPCD